jgi:hypothetical protein
MRGDMSMAPMITGVELTLRPIEAMTIAMARIHALGPLNSIFFLMDLSADSVSRCASMFVRFLNESDILLKIPILLSVYPTNIAYFHLKLFNL